jgi:hypothetical protein
MKIEMEELAMTKISFQAVHEQVNPGALLDDATYMDRRGIEKCWSSDHYMPWWSCMALAWGCIGQDGEVDNGHRSNSSDIEISSCYCGSSLCNSRVHVSQEFS